MKKLVVLASIILSLCVFLASCAETCSTDGCTEKVYKDGLCADHYVELQTELSKPTPAPTKAPSVVDGLQDKYQPFIDDGISRISRIMKDPSSLQINGIYIRDASLNYGHRSYDIFFDISGKNGFGGVTRTAFYYRVGSAGVEEFSECETQAAKELFGNVVEICTGQRSSKEATKLDTGYYERYGYYYLTVPSSWY